MRLKHVYAGLCVVGTVLPGIYLIEFLSSYGLNLQAFFGQLFSTPVGGFFGMDVIVSSLVLWVFVATEGRGQGLKQLWLPIVANLTVGVSLGLPLFLYMRESLHAEKGRARTA